MTGQADSIADYGQVAAVDFKKLLPAYENQLSKSGISHERGLNQIQNIKEFLDYFT